MLSIQDVLTFPLKEAAVASLQYVFLLLDRITCFYKPDSVERKSDPGGFSRIEHQFGKNVLAFMVLWFVAVWQADRSCCLLSVLHIVCPDRQ